MRDNGCTDEQDGISRKVFGNAVRANVYIDGQLRDEFICFEDGDGFYTYETSAPGLTRMLDLA